MIYDDADLASMSLCVWKEARGEGDQGMQAVANVIINRANAWYTVDPIHTAIYAKNQFTSMSVPSDPEFNLQPPANDPQYTYCVSICVPIITKQMPDLTNGALYYANLAEVTSGWFSRNISGPNGKGMPDHPLVATIGKQNFYK